MTLGVKPPHTDMYSPAGTRVQYAVEAWNRYGWREINVPNTYSAAISNALGHCNGAPGHPSTRVVVKAREEGVGNWVSDGSIAGEWQYDYTKNRAKKVGPPKAGGEN